jgi:hypothetical protein
MTERHRQMFYGSIVTLVTVLVLIVSSQHEAGTRPCGELARQGRSTTHQQAER